VTRFLLRRALWFVATTWAVVTAAFFLLRTAPGGPFSGERRLHPAVEASLRERHHLDWPLWRQYAHTVGPLNLDGHGLFGDRSDVFGGVLALDFGPSMQHRDVTVNDVLAQSLPISITLGSLALAIAVVFGLGAGVASAHRPGSKLDSLVRAAATTGLVLPNFVIASLLILVFAFWFPILPVAGYGAPRHLVLPAIALALPFAAYIARLSRAGLLETLSKDYIRTALAKGASRSRILWRHALRGALAPVVSFLGPAAAGVLTGSLVIERIFAIPGAGTHFIASALNRDYTMAMGVTVVYAVMVFGFNTAVDVAYTLLDPRIDLEHDA
jgi:ABC-type dipeptide/oligopeptide/nickel transport system permease component